MSLYKQTIQGILYFLIALSLLPLQGYAKEPLKDDEQIATILSQAESPDGIVFELIGNDEDYLPKALEKVEAYKKQLHEKFPKLDIAVVSHGSEQFNLTKDKAKQYEGAHFSVQSLARENITVHICETHAGWKGVTAEDFPDYINVSASGPAQINQYKELGYILIQVMVE